MKKVVFNRRTREDISNPFHEIPHQKLLNHAGAVNLRDNHRVVSLKNGYIRVEAIDETKVFSCPLCSRGEYCATNEKIVGIQQKQI